MWNLCGVTTLFELDQLTVRAAEDSPVVRARTYLLLDATGAPIGNVEQQAGSAGDVLRRNVARSRITMPADFAVRDAAGALVLSVTKRRAGLLMPKVVIEAALANGAVVAHARAAGRTAMAFDVSDAQGTPVATLRRSGRTLFAVADAAGGQAGAVELEGNTLSARRAGQAHPNSYSLSFALDAGTLVRIGTLAVVLGFDSIRGV
jgi:hypothetical protein